MNTKSSALNEGKALPLLTNIAYGSGDMACNVVYGMATSLITMFYTDYVGVAAASVAVIMLWSRIFDGFSDVVMGFIVSHTKSKWGQARCWVLWMAIPYGIGGILLFTVPQTNASIQFWYIFLTYNLATTVFYTMLNVPYGTLAALMTRDAHARDMLSVFRMGLSPIGRILSVVLTMPLVKLFGDNQLAWIKTMSIWAVIAAVLIIFCFSQCKETVHVEAKVKEKISIWKNLKGLLTNIYFWAVLLLCAVQASYNTVIGTVMPYYCKYILGNDTWMYSALYFLETVILIVGILLCPLLRRRFSKRSLGIAGAAIAVIAQILFLIQPLNFGWLVMVTVIRALGTVPLNAFLMSFMCEVIEYGQWKNHFRQESLVYSGTCVGFKFGMGIIGAVVGFMMQAAGFISSTTGSAVQPQPPLTIIQNLAVWAPVVLWVIGGVILLLYRLEKRYSSIMHDLTEREARGEL